MALDLTILPPTYLLPTHLTLPRLHELEDTFTRLGAPLTYNLPEARLIIGLVGTKRRAEFELRARGLWTEEKAVRRVVTNPNSQDNGTEEKPVRKRRRIGQVAFTPKVEDVIVIEDSSTESEPGDSDVAIQRPQPLLHVSQSSPIDPGYESGTADTTAPFNTADLIDSVKVVKLDWYENSVKAGSLLPLQQYLVYDGRPIVRPDNAVTPTRSSKTTTVQAGSSSPALVSKSPRMKPGDFKGILERAKADANNSTIQNTGTRRHTYASKSQRSHGQAFADRSFTSSSQHASQSASQGYTRPTQLVHQTTSEHDEGVSSEMPEMPVWVKQGKKYACERPTPANSLNEAFIEQLKKIKLARLLTADEIGVRAYSTSIASLLAYPHTLTNTREIIALPGCDAKIANLFYEWKTNSGCIKAVSDISSDEILTVLRLFYEIWGVGATTARHFYFDKGWRDLDDIVEHGWSTLSRVQQIGVKYYDEFLHKIPRDEVESIASIIMQHAHRIRDENMQHCIVGGYRRGKAACGDVDIIITHHDEDQTLGFIHDIVASLETEGWITHTLTLNLTNSKRDQQTLAFRADGGGHGFDSLDKALVVWQDINWPSKQPDLATNPNAKNPNIHRRVDIIIAPWRTVGCAIVGWSGGNTFERDLRRYAKNVKGWKFDSSGVRDRATGEVMDLEGEGGPSETWMEAEKKVFRGFGLEWREPWERCTD
ncbi:MAG: hypothetical protein M1827_006785 [Pycnora praestabilis]|nr:MAG: hypothetical protein M1827_006785 [Pycnora praestabilis]